MRFPVIRKASGVNRNWNRRVKINEDDHPIAVQQSAPLLFFVFFYRLIVYQKSCECQEGSHDDCLPFRRGDDNYRNSGKIFEAVDQTYKWIPFKSQSTVTTNRKMFSSLALIWQKKRQIQLIFSFLVFIFFQNGKYNFFFISDTSTSPLEKRVLTTFLDADPLTLK